MGDHIYENYSRDFIDGLISLKIININKDKTNHPHKLIINGNTLVNDFEIQNINQACKARPYKPGYNRLKKEPIDNIKKSIKKSNEKELYQMVFSPELANKIIKKNELKKKNRNDELIEKHYRDINTYECFNIKEVRKKEISYQREYHKMKNIPKEDLDPADNRNDKTEKFIKSMSSKMKSDMIELKVRDIISKSKKNSDIIPSIKRKTKEKRKSAMPIITYKKKENKKSEEINVNLINQYERCLNEINETNEKMLYNYLINMKELENEKKSFEILK